MVFVSEVWSRMQKLPVSVSEHCLFVYFDGL